MGKVTFRRGRFVVACERSLASSFFKVEMSISSREAFELELATTDGGGGGEEEEEEFDHF